MANIKNLHSRKLTEFTPEDTIYIKDKSIEIGPRVFLCQFVEFNEKKQTVTGVAIERTKQNDRMGQTLTAKYDSCALFGSTSAESHNFYHWFDSTLRATHPLDEEMETGHEDVHVPKHPSYGLVSFSRRSSNGTPLFGSSIQHTQTITLNIKRAEHKRDLNHDWYLGTENIVQVEMSQTQFVDAITSMNMGDGVPCTIKWVEGKTAPPTPFHSKIDMFHDEFKADMRNLNRELEKLTLTATDILVKKASITKGDRELILKSIEKLRSEISSNIPYVEKLFAEQMDKTVTEAKGEIEAFIAHKIHSAGIKALNNEDFPTLKLNPNNEES